MRAHILLAFLALVAAPRSGLSQTPGGNGEDPLTPRCGPGQAPVIDTAVVAFVARPDHRLLRRSAAVTSRARAEFAVRTLASFFQRPVVITIQQPQGWYGTPGRRDPLPGSSGTVLLRPVERGGVEVRWREVTESPELNDAVDRALHAADSARAFEGVMARSDAPITIQLAAVDSVRDGDQPLARLRVAYYPLEELVQVVHVPTPRYPTTLVREALNGRVEVRYVVGTDGRIVPATFEVRAFSDSAFVPPARKALLEGRFKPAHGHGCVFSTRISQAVTFRTH